MSEDNTNQANNNSDDQGDSTNSNSSEQNSNSNSNTNQVTLSRDEYASLTTQLAVAQSQLDQLLANANTDSNQQRQQQNNTQAKNVNEMTNSELLEIINQTVNQQVAQPLMNTIMQLALKEEMREVQDSHPDFKDLKLDVYKEAEKNTHLSLEQAYLIVKARKAGLPEPKMPPANNSAPNNNNTSSEKPTVNVASVQPEPKMSIREAAAAALKTLKYNN